VSTENVIKNNINGFTLLEVIVSLLICSIIITPLSLWFYRNHQNQLAWDKYYATQLLKKELHRAFLEKRDMKSEEELQTSKYYKITIDVQSDKNETIYLGTVHDSRGTILSNLVISRYDKH
jgi:prepilin-type N-terminal cleavage/methylation domain-containing protein